MALTDAGAPLPCLNPSCKSHGTSHPHCRCYPGLAAGGIVAESYCDSNRAHASDCEYFAEGGEVSQPEPMDRIGSQCLQDALSNGFLRGHGEISDAILGHGDAKPLVSAIIANGGAPSLLKMGSSSIFTPRVAMKKATTADRTKAFLSGIGASHRAGTQESADATNSGLDHPWFRKGASFHQEIPELQADPKSEDFGPAAEKLLGRDVHGSAQDFLAPVAIKLLAQGADPDEFEHGIHFAEHIGKGLQKIDKSIKNMFDPEAEVEMPDIKTRQKIHEYVSQGKLHDDVLEELSEQSAPLTEGADPIAKHFPDQNMLLQQTKAAMVNVLNSARPYSQPGLTFDTPFTTKMAQRKYDQALDVAANPLSIFGRIKTGTVTPGEIASLRDMYPYLYDVMKTKLTEKLMDIKANKQSVAPNVRRSMALFLGTALDTTMTPLSIQNVQAMYAKQRAASQQQQQGGKAKGASPQKLDKVAQGAQTDSQALAARQQRPR